MTMSELTYGDRVRSTVTGRKGIFRVRAGIPVVDLDSGDTWVVSPDGDVRPADLEIAGGAL